MTSLAATATVTKEALAARRAFCSGIVVAALLTAAAALMVPGSLLPWLWLGLGAAVLVSALVMLLHGRALAIADADARLASMRLQSLLGLGFAAKLAGLGAGVGLLWWFGLKFEALAAFALTFVATAMVIQLVAAAVLARTLARRAAAARRDPIHPR